MKGAFIVLEGLDGAGTTTMARHLIETLENEGVPAAFTCEPSNGPIGTLIRQALGGRLVRPDGTRLDGTTLALLFAADRIDHHGSEIAPLLDRGVTVVCDRYFLSSLAYQGQEIDTDFVEGANSRAPTPDLTLFLRVTPQTALSRRRRRYSGEELYEALETQRRVADAYEKAMDRHRESHQVRIIDAERGLPEVAADCVDAVRRVLEKRSQGS